MYYFDGVWVNEGHTTSEAWADTTVRTKNSLLFRPLHRNEKLHRKSKTFNYPSHWKWFLGGAIASLLIEKDR
jgi:hypothetical protein